MVQLELCAHTVISWCGGPALVMGFEGKQEKDPTWKKQALQCYSTGITKERRNFLLQNHSDATFYPYWKLTKKKKRHYLSTINASSRIIRLRSLTAQGVGLVLLNENLKFGILGETEIKQDVIL